MGGAKLLTMTIQELIDQVKEEIKARDLAYRHGGDNRIRIKVYQKYYLMNFLREHKLTFEEIGDLFGLKHCTVIYGVQQAEWLKKDRMFLKVTDELRQKFENYTAINYPINRNIIHDVMECDSFYQMRIIQRDIKKGFYGVTE